MDPVNRWLLIGGLLLGVTADAQTITFIKVADTSTAVPNGTGNFVTFSNMVSVDAQGRVGFVENNGPTNNGVYFWDSGTLTRVADLNTAIPSGTGNFTGFSFFGNDMADGRLIFRGNGSSSQAGLYLFDASGSTLTKIADTSTSIPGGTGNFTSFGTGFISGSNYATIASGSSGQQGIYVTDGSTVTKIADKNSTVPDIGGTYSWSSQLGFDGSSLSFWANISGGSQPGNIIGGYNGSSLVTLVTTGTTAPGFGTNFTSFGAAPDLEGATVYFSGSVSGGSGLFSIGLDGTGLTSLVTTDTTAPGHGNFTAFSQPTVENGVLYFQASYSGGQGIYYYDGLALSKIIDTDDMLDGKGLSSLSLFPTGVEGSYLAFRANFSDSSIGIFTTQLAAIPEPTTTSQLLAGMAVFGFVNGLRRRKPALHARPGDSVQRAG
jgi:hypothetical protein